VVATNANGNSTDSNVLDVITQAPPTRPTAPSALSAGNPTTNSVNLNWQDASNNEECFKVYYSASGSTWTMVGTTEANQTSFLVSGLKDKTSYQFKVIASNEVGDSDASNIARATTTAIKVAAPTNLKASSVQRTSFKLTWERPAGTVNHFDVYVKSGGTWKLSEEVQGHRTAATIEFESRNGPRLKAGNTYQVKMRAIDKAGRVSDWSAEITVKMAK
jgi:fibronectin type 3 domain-containing protein